MGWTSPTDRTTGYGVTAADWNVVQDDLTYLYARPQFAVTLAVAVSIATGGSGSQIQFDTVVKDTSGGWSAVTHQYAIPTGETGLWLFSSSGQWASNGTGNRRTYISVAGVLYQGPQIAASNDPLGISSVSALVSCTAGQNVQAFGYQTSGGALNTGSGAPVYLSGVRVG